MSGWVWWMIAGVFSLLGGFLALTNPFAATLASTLLTGWAFLFVGLIVFFSAFRDQGWGARIMALLLGIVMFALGVNLIGEPLAGAVSLTIVVGIMLLVGGVFRIGIGFSVGAGQLRWAMLISGALSILLSIMIFSDFPQSAAVVLGIFLAVELISNGITLIMLSMARRNGDSAA